MRTLLFPITMLLATLFASPARALDQTLWLDASDPSTIDYAPNTANVVERWRDKTSHGNDLIRQHGAPLHFSNGIELVERISGVPDHLKGSAVLASSAEAFAMFLVCRPYRDAAYIVAFAGHHLTLLHTRCTPSHPCLGLLLSLNCFSELVPPVIGPTQIYAVRREPSGTGTQTTFWRSDGTKVDLDDPCAPLELHSLEFNNGSVSFPTNETKGMQVFEVRAYTAPASPDAELPVISDAFIENTMQELATKWDLEGPTPARSTTWGQIKTLYR